MNGDTSGTQASHLSSEQIATLCRRAFGEQARIRATRPLGGGTVNETYRIELEEREAVILRAAPPPASIQLDQERDLMRREFAVRPYFAAIGDLLPPLLGVDFTHQLIGRDVMFQACLPGERWSDVEDELSVEEETALWQQCGEIARRIHATPGEAFGYPPPGRQFSCWSQVVLERIDRTSADLSSRRLEIEAYSRIAALAHNQAGRLDEVRRPHLLHGDLWTFNLLINRNASPPKITGVLDADRAWWGDPLADWTMFLLDIRRDELDWQPRLEAFFTGYGPQESDDSARFRRAIYRAMHIGAAAVWSLDHNVLEDVERARRDLDAIAISLRG